MSEISTAALFGKLNSAAYRSIDGAVVLCKMRGNPEVELAHWVSLLVQAQGGDWQRLLRRYELDDALLAKQVTDALDRLPRGATSIRALSENVKNAVERGWVYGSLMYGATQVRTGHLLLGMLKTDLLRKAL
jgi:type VI secretion system protein VasG